MKFKSKVQPILTSKIKKLSKKTSYSPSLNERTENKYLRNINSEKREKKNLFNIVHSAKEQRNNFWLNQKTESDEKIRKNKFFFNEVNSQKSSNPIMTELGIYEVSNLNESYKKVLDNQRVEVLTSKLESLKTLQHSPCFDKEKNLFKKEEPYIKKIQLKKYKTLNDGDYNFSKKESTICDSKTKLQEKSFLKMPSLAKSRNSKLTDENSYEEILVK